MIRSKVLGVFASGMVAGSLSTVIASQFTKKDTNADVEGRLKRGQEILKYGSPNGPSESYYGNHVLHYDKSRKIPLWVAEHLTSKSLKGKANRQKAKFKPDPSIDKEFSATNEDYWKSGWSRGHMAPAGNNKCSQEAMNETFYLSNVLPQDIQNNGGFWNRFEIYCRELTEKFENVRIISGPVMLPQKAEDGSKFVKYPVIGDSEVAVPTHLYKVIVVENGEERAMASFIVPNIPISFNHSLKEYKVPLETVEKTTGLRMLPKLEKSTVKDMCDVNECELMNKEQFELYILEKRLWSANTKERMDKVWNKLDEKKLKPTQKMQEIYKRKKSEFAAKEATKSEE